MTNFETAKKYENYTISMRRYFHENPELSGCEDNTVNKVCEELSNMGLTPLKVKNGGVLAFIKGEKDNGKTILLRADMDALPVTEKENLTHNRTCWSKVSGVMHACGHDAHTAMLLGAAKILVEKKSDIEGTVLLCFERGEEAGGNVKYIFKYMEDNNIVPNCCFGVHVEPTLETGKIAINKEDVLAGAMGFDITIEGRGGHGSRPDQSINPMGCFASIYKDFEAMRLSKIDPFKTCTYSIGKLTSGIQGNVIPQTLNFSGTMRCFDSDGVGMKFYNQFKKIIDCNCELHDCKATYNQYSLPGFATVNDIECSEFASAVLKSELGEENVVVKEPLMGSESYSRYLKQWPGVFGLLGVGNTDKGTGAINHNEAFDIDEEALKYGAASHAEVAIKFLKSDFITTHKKKLTFKECLIANGQYDDLKLFYGE